jgi:hypothetical protein
MVSNVGGLLTPLGDPPLFLGCARSSVRFNIGRGLPCACDMPLDVQKLMAVAVYLCEGAQGLNTPARPQSGYLARKILTIVKSSACHNNVKRYGLLSNVKAYWLCPTCNTYTFCGDYRPSALLADTCGASHSAGHSDCGGHGRWRWASWPPCSTSSTA